MSEWQKVKFLDVVHLNPRISLEKGVEYPFVEMSNVVPCARKPEKDVFKKYLGEGTKFEQGDTIVARIEPCLQNGKGFQCSYKQGFGSTEFLVFRPVNINDLDCDFLYYYMGQQSIREAMAKTMVGASGRQRVNNKVFNDLQINLPPLSTQHRIANILSRYNSLIENYQKQIKLLEEAARRLYKEWFIDLRFPRHENTKIVDGLPEGWERKKVGEIGTVITGKTPSTSNKENYGGSIPFITIPDMHTGIYPVSSVFLSEKGAESQSKKYIPQGALIVSCIGTAGLVCITKERCQTNQQINSLILDDKEMLHYMYFVFLSLKEHLNNIGSNGATMTNVNKSKFEGIDIVVPSSCIIRDFSKRTGFPSGTYVWRSAHLQQDDSSAYLRNLRSHRKLSEAGRLFETHL